MESDSRSDTSTLTEANEKFCFDVYNVLSSSADSIIFSPFGLEVTLTLLYVGAKGKTAKEISNALHMPSDKEIILDCLTDFLHKLQNEPEIVLQTASKIYTQIKFPINESFTVDAKKLLAEAEPADFENEHDKTRMLINEWVQKKTDNKICNCIPHGVLDYTTRLLLLNVVYFKGKWEHPFPKIHTSPMSFYISPSQTKEVPMMKLGTQLMHADVSSIEAQALELPYKGKNLSMVVLLPYKNDGLTELEKKLQTVNISHILTLMTPKKVNVMLPKFLIEKEIQLEDTLKQLGVEEIFSEQLADLSGITGHSELCVSQIFHKVFIEVTEEGTEAAAVSGGNSLSSSNRNPPFGGDSVAAAISWNFSDSESTGKVRK